MQVWNRWPRLFVSLLLLLGVAPGCPALLDDEFDVVPVLPDASSGGTAGDASVGAAGDGGMSAGGMSAGGTSGIGAGGQGGYTGDAGPDASVSCTTCAANETCCDGTCADLLVSRENCNACGTGCPGTICVSGQCSSACAEGFLDCNRNAAAGDGCEANVATDTENCGNCGIRCPFGATCVGGNCKCPAGTANCDPSADNGCEVDVTSDSRNCGGCGISCGANEVCANSECVCVTGFAECNNLPEDGCEADLSDARTCGSCSNDCGDNSVCVGSASCGCAAGFLDCDIVVGCESAKTSPATCGTCNVQCSGGTPVCDGIGCGTGCTVGTEPCGSSCVDLLSDPQNCGGCGRAVGNNQLCDNGTPSCVAGFADCNGFPTDGCEIDIRADTTHCGRCDLACKPGSICSGGACQCAATTPNDCGTECLECCNATQCSDGNPCTTDVCGASGTCSSSAGCDAGTVCCAQQGCFECCSDADCTGGRVCSANQCVTPTCQSPMTLCGQNCVDTQTNAAHCGGCGIECGPGRTCVTGRCTPQWVTTASAPSTLVGRSRAAYAWTGTRLFIWGGQNASGTSVNTGALYDPQTDTWTELPVTAQTPGARVLATAVWTGQEVIVWGGGNASGTNNVNTGSRYDPVTNTWRAMTTSSAPSPRRAPVGVWTGSRALFWGGIQAGGEPHDGTDLYDPIGDAWSKASNNLPGALLDAATGWSGTDFFVFGGQTAIGGTPNDRLYRYRPATDSWQLLNSGPSRRTGAFGSFDGRYFVIWAGYGGFTTLNELNSGSRYDPTANSWTTLTLTGAPTARASSHRASGWAARISGGKTLFLGGFAERGNANSVQRNGGIYDSTTNVWTTVPAWPSGEARLWAVAVWTGNEFVLWGGNNPTTPTATGERFRP